MSSILIVDDEKGIRAGLSTALSRVGYQVVAAASLAEARARLAEANVFDCALVDIRLKDGSGLDLLRELRTGRHRELPVVVATAYDDSERTIEAMRDGAFDYITKPFDLPRLLAMVQRGVRRRRSKEVPSEVPVDTTPLIGKSAPMHAVWKVIGRAAGSRAPVLVKGEAGTGKELVARAIHDYSSSADSAFRSIRVDARTEVSALESALSLAVSGTLLLEGVEELPAAGQSFLATWLAASPPVRVVAQVRLQPGAADAAVIAELYCQLAVFEISVPPLRDRRSDVPLLVSRALTATRARSLTPEAMAALIRHDWPGNVRELFLVIRRAAEMCSSGIIDANDLPPELSLSQLGVTSEPTNRYLGLPLREAIARLERDLLTNALRKSEGNRTAAARMLGIARPQLYAKLEEHGLTERRSAPPVAK